MTVLPNSSTSTTRMTSTTISTFTIVREKNSFRACLTIRKRLAFTSATASSGTVA